MISFVKLATYLALHVILTIFALILITVASASIYAKSNDNLSSPLSTKIEVGVARPNQNDIIRISDENKTSLGYNSTLSGDCSGGMMSVETKKCTITNIYSIKVRK